jgi:hypothetical protein
MSDFWDLLAGLGDLRHEHGPYTTASTAIDLLHPKATKYLIERKFVQLPYEDRLSVLISLESQLGA